MKKRKILVLLTVVMCLFLSMSALAAKKKACKTHRWNASRGVCTVCGKKCSHSCIWVTTKKATCKTKGEKAYRCKTCGYVKKRKTTAKIGHKFEEAYTKWPTCCEDGKVTYKCAFCGKKKYKTLEKTNSHVWSKTTYIAEIPYYVPVTDKNGKTELQTAKGTCRKCTNKKCTAFEYLNPRTGIGWIVVDWNWR